MKKEDEKTLTHEGFHKRDLLCYTTVKGNEKLTVLNGVRRSWVIVTASR